ncbi:helix-turn-helix domain-containing protein [Agrobacterium tumefaciens]|uniref:helix-turn-helix domain-containing protein n=1 Tax=Agrobacterium tumefaciens TaxID=358 RepID=UPI001EEDD5AB
MRLFFKALWCRDYTKSIPFTLGAARIGVRGWRWRQSIKRKLIFPHAVDPALTPATAAEHFRISVRYVHRLLEDSGETFSQFLLRQRLQKCADDLRTKGGCSIGEIAFRWGFNDLSHFSRSFRNQFGVAPREYRVQ